MRVQPELSNDPPPPPDELDSRASGEDPLVVFGDDPSEWKTGAEGAEETGGAAGGAETGAGETWGVG
jgi:hypothetical protein